MNSSVIEIVSIIIKKMLKDEFIDQREVITELIDDGYEVEDIDRAFALILSEENILEETEEDITDNKQINYNRIFTSSEKMYLPLKLQGLIYRLMLKNVLSANESEKLISRTVKNVYNGSIKTKDLWNTLRDIINDERRLEIISKEIPEFSNFLKQKYKYVN